MRGNDENRSVVGRRARWPVVVVLAGVLALLTGCGLSIPADPDDTLERVRGGVLRVGVSPHEPWTVWADEPEPTGREIELIRGFAATLPARVEWSRGTEADLIARMERGELDLVAAGLTANTPWVDHAALTTPHSSGPGPDGTAVDYVLAVPLGENAFLVRLERFLRAAGGPGR